MANVAKLWRMDWKGPLRGKEMSQGLSSPSDRDDAGSCERERTVVKQRDFKEVGLTVGD